uniref:Multiple C2 and transmembrane domain-containing protein 1-like n=1 Tax=Elaeophora elaphi TaxID=1147741 RepID=A0A0R3RQC8_9BILA
MSSSLLKGVFRRESSEGRYRRLKEKDDISANILPTPSSTTNQQKCDVPAEDRNLEAYVTFSVRICLKEGHNLAVRDASGSSDPYVKFKYKDRTYFKSPTIYKSLNPVWEEEFTLLIDDPTTPMYVDVYDHDRWATDDYMGGAIIDLSQLRLFQMTAMKLKLREEGNDENMGELDVMITLSPLTAIEKDEVEFLKKATRGIICERSKKSPQKKLCIFRKMSEQTCFTVTQVWSSIANIVLIEGRNLIMPDGSENNFPDPFVKFKLGSEKYKSRHVVRSTSPKWLEQFDLHLFDEPKHVLEMMVIDKKTNLSIGRCSLDLDKLEKETSNQIICDLDHGTGSILVLISVTGTSSTDAVIDLTDFSGDDVRNAIIEKYSLRRTHQSFSDVGFLIVKGKLHQMIFRACNLASIDVMNKSNPFVVIELVNAFLQTHTEYKTVNPEWNKIFTFAVKDIHSILEITIYDEDPNKKAEFLGKIAIPLLQIRNCEPKWYALKDRKLRTQAKGQILLEMDIIWNPIRAAIRTFTPREQKYTQIDPKFKRRLFMNSYARLREFFLVLMQVRDYVQSCFDWDSPVRSLFAFIVSKFIFIDETFILLFVIFVYFFHIHHVPIIILLFFLRPHKVKCLGQSKSSKNKVKSVSESEEEPETVDVSGQSSSSIRERFNTLQDTMAKIQNMMDFSASLLERVRNTFNFTQPYLSTLAIVTLSIITVLLYFVPLRWLIMIWGINKFTKKLRNPNFIPNNELLDFLSRVPSNSEIV